MNRAHKYTRQRCPRYQDGQDWLAAKITKRHEFFVPALSAGAPRVQVSCKFLCRLFDVQDTALQTLQGHPPRLERWRAIQAATTAITTKLARGSRIAFNLLSSSSSRPLRTTTCRRSVSPAGG
jgi:hypothetical protein